MAKKSFVTRARQKWLARSFQGVFLITTAAAAGEPFLKLPAAGRAVLIVLVFVSFLVGLYFAKADRVADTMEDT